MQPVKNISLTPDIARRSAFSVREKIHYLFPISETLLQYLVLSWEHEKERFIVSLMDQHRNMGQEAEVFIVLATPIYFVHELQDLFFGICRKELKIKVPGADELRGNSIVKTEGGGFVITGPAAESLRAGIEKFKKVYLYPAYPDIVKLLQSHGFTVDSTGGMYRSSTGCSFPFECLAKYKTVIDFQLEWPYYVTKG